MNNVDSAPLIAMWQQTRRGVAASPAEWSQQLKAIYAAGKGLHESLEFLHQHRPPLDAFLDWMNAAAVATGSVESTAMLSDKDLRFFNEQGYLIVPAAVTAEACELSRSAISEHLGINLSDPQTWYNVGNLTQGLMVPLYQHPALDDNRRSPKIKKVFEQLYQTTAIHPVIDKVSFNPPVTDDYQFKGSALHWDASLAQPIPFKLQGLLYLSDCNPEAGAFHCVPGFHLRVGSWLDDLPPGIDPRAHALETLLPTAIPGRAGDLIIWHQALPHCATPNRGAAPRIVQYISYDPDDYVGQEVWM